MITLATIYAVLLTAWALALRWYHRRANGANGANCANCTATEKGAQS